MTTDLVIRPAVEGDVNRIVDLLKICLGEGTIPREVRYWEWKHLHNPFGVSPVLLAEAGGQLVGLRAFMRWAWMCRGRRVPVVRAVDTATHPDWRGKGLFTKLTLRLLDQVRSEGTAFVFNTPNRLSMPGYLKMGWRRVGKLAVWLRPLNPIRTLRSLVVRPANTNGADGISPVGETIDALVRAPGVEELTAHRDGEDRLTTARSTQYLSWRYGQIPGFQYRALWDMTRDAGAMVLFRTRNRGRLTELRLCEVLVGSGDESVRRCAGLVRELLSSEKRANYALAMATPGTEAAHVLAKAGFLRVQGIGPILVARGLNETSCEPFHRSGWNVSIGDVEIF